MQGAQKEKGVSEYVEDVIRTFRALYLTVLCTAGFCFVVY